MNESRPPKQAEEEKEQQQPEQNPSSVADDAAAEEVAGQSSASHDTLPDEADQSTAGDEPTAGAATAADDTAGGTAAAEAEGDERESAAATALQDDASGDGANGAVMEEDNGAGGGWSPGTVIALVLAALIVSGFAVAGGYLFWRLERVEEQLAQVPDELRDEISAAVSEVDNSGQVSQLRDRLAEEREARQSLATDTDQRLQDFDAALAELRELAIGHHSRWRLAEIRYLIGMAARRLQIAEDPAGAVAALEAADQAVNRLRDPRLLPLREAIVDDIASIRELQPPDVEGTALRLLSLEGAVTDLPTDRGAAETVDSPEVDPEAPLWKRLLARLQGLVEIRRRDAEPSTVDLGQADELPPADALRVDLRRARAAALAGDGERYAQAIDNARTIIAEEFDSASDSVSRFAEELAQLGDRQVELQAPDLEATLDQLGALRARLEAERERARTEAQDNGGNGEADE